MGPRDLGKTPHEIRRTCQLKSTSACDQVLLSVAAVTPGLGCPTGRQRPSPAPPSDTLGSQWMREENTVKMS